MRIQFSSKNHCANLAKSLKREVSPLLPSVKLSECQNAIGRMMGYRNWHEFEAGCSRGTEQSPFDEDAPADMLGARRIQFVAALSASLGLRTGPAGEIVDRMAPMSSRPQGRPGTRHRDEHHITAPLHLFEGEWGTGIAMPLPAVWDYPVTVLVVGYTDKRVAFFKHRVLVKDSDEARRLVEDGGLRPEAIPGLEYVLEFLGYRQSVLDRRTIWDPRSMDAQDAERRLAEARAHIERHLDRSSFQAWATASGFVHTPWVYDALREGSLSSRRAAFAKAYPTYLNHIGDRGRDHSLERVDDAPTPVHAMASWLAGAHAIDEQGAVELLERMGSLRPLSEFPNEVRKAYGLLWRLGHDRLPRSQAELDAFMRCQWVMEHAFSGRALDESKVLTRLLAGAKGDGSWEDAYERIVSEATRGVGRLIAEGVQCVGEDDSPNDVIIDFYKVADNCMSHFAWDTVEPALGLSNDRVRELHAGGTNFPAEGGVVIPPTPFENACSKLFLDDLGFEDLLVLAHDWHLQRANQGYRSKPRLRPITRRAVEERLDGWRRFLRPRYRDISLDEVLEASAEGMAMQGATIGGSRKGRRPAPTVAA
ncbi:hypothetical protein [Methylobacterium fujisawaense]